MIIPMIDIIFFLLVFFMMSVEQDAYDLNGMAKRLEAEKAKGGDLTIILRADQRAQYGEFVQVLDTLKNMQLNKIAVATESK